MSTFLWGNLFTIIFWFVFMTVIGRALTKRHPDPNKLLTKVRRRVAEAIEPRPHPGEAWCVNCTLEGKTAVILVDLIQDHVKNQHRNQDGVEIVMSWAADDVPTWPRAD